MARRTLVVDNYDSFTYNLVALVAERGGRPVVLRHDDPALVKPEHLDPTHILISPGPGNPLDSGACLDLIRHFLPVRPILGVCLGYQCLAHLAGATTVRAPVAVHGRTSTIHHDGQGLFRGLPEPLRAARYHSLVVREEDLEPDYQPTAHTTDGLLMGIRHRDRPVAGIQFHPESFMTEAGAMLIDNFLEME